MLIFSRNIKLLIVTIASAALLTGCGGGGSSSGGGTISGGNSGGGGNSSPTVTGLPTLVTESFLEGEINQQGNVQFFNITVSDPSIDATNIRLTGADAAFFSVLLSLTQNSTNSTSFELSLDPSAIVALDFENPSDQDSNNVYDFNVSFDYSSTTYNIPFQISITNVSEFTALTVGFFEGVPTGLKAVPDYSGDMHSELLLGGDDFSSVKVLSSLDIETSKNVQASFFQDFLTTAEDPENLTSDVVFFDVLENGSGGVEALIQPSLTDTPVKLFDLQTGPDIDVIRGVITADTDHPSVINYAKPDTRSYSVRLTTDINGGGANDLIYAVDFGGQPRSYGIVFGRIATDQADQSRTLSPNVVLNLHPNNFSGVSAGINVHRVPDIDGDGIEEIVIDDRVASAIDTTTGGQVAEGVYTFIYSQTINSSTGPIDVWDLDPGQGFQLYTPFGIGGTSETTSAVTMGSDYDGDGSASVIIPFYAGVLVIDTDELAALSSITDVTTLPGYMSFENDSLFSAAAIGDLDNDGHDEIMFRRGIISGQAIVDALASGSGDLIQENAVSFDFGNIGGSSRVERIIDLPDQNLIALSGFDGTFILERGEIESAYASVDGGLIFNVGF